ncbi:uncharacterized protein O3C94_011100 isoform 2-T2 [Discoglossus pictus]
MQHLKMNNENFGEESICFPNKDNNISFEKNCEDFTLNMANKNRKQISKEAECYKPISCYFPDPVAPVPVGEGDFSRSAYKEEHKYFSTPMASKVKPKMLTPVMEVEFECSVSTERNSNGGAYEPGVLYTRVSDTKSQDSPMKTPLYQSFFAAECLEIAHQLESHETDSIGKITPEMKRREPLDMSTIEAESLPCDWTPMRSMMTRDVSNILSVDISSTQEGGSLLGESILDLDKMNMQLCDFSKLFMGPSSQPFPRSTNLCKDNSLDVDFIEGIGFLGEESLFSGEQQKEETIEKEDTEDQNINGTMELPVAVDVTHITGSPQERDVLHKQPANTTQDIVPPHNVNRTQDIEAVSSPSSNIVIHNPGSHDIEVTSVNTTQLMSPPQWDSVCEVVPKQPANNTQDILPLNSTNINITQNTDFVLSNSSANVIAPQDTELTAVNTTQVIVPTQELDSVGDVVPKQFANTTQDIVPLLNVDTTEIIEVISKPSDKTTHEFTVGNTTPVIWSPKEWDGVEVSKHFVNMPQDIVPLLNANTARVIDGVSKTSAITTCDIEVATVNTTQVILSPQEWDIVGEVVTKQSVNITQDIVPLLNTSNTQEVEVVTKPSANSTHNIEVEVINTTQVIVFTEDPRNVTETPNGELVDGSLAAVIDPSNIPNQEKSVHDKVNATQDLALTQHGNCSIKVTVGHDTQITELGKVKENSTESIKVTADHTTLVSLTAQIGLEIGIPGQLVTDGTSKEADSCVVTTLSRKVDKSSPNEMLSDPEPSDISDQIPEGEIMHNESVFSLQSFITSTPLPGYLNFNFMRKSCGDLEQHDPNLSICSVVDEAPKKVTEQSVSTHQESLVLPSFACDTQGIKEQQAQRDSPPNSQKNIHPQAEGTSRPVQSTSASLSAQSSLALNTSSEGPKLSKQSISSRLPPKGSMLPGRSSIRPPMARLSLLRPSKENDRQSLGGENRGDLKIETTGCSFRAPKEVGQQNKLSSKPAASTGGGASLVRPSSRLSAPGSSRLSLGGPTKTSSLQDAACGPRISALRPPAPTGGRPSLLLRPGQSSLRPPHSMRSQKPSPVAAPPRDVRTSSIATSSSGSLRLGRCQRSTNGNILPSPKWATKGLMTQSSKPQPQTQLSVSSTKKADSSATTPIEASSVGEAADPVQMYGTAKDPTNCSENTEFTNCFHIETCTCCHKIIQQLRQELEELQKKLSFNTGP